MIAQTLKRLDNKLSLILSAFNLRIKTLMRLISSQQLATSLAPPAHKTTIPARPAPSVACCKTDFASAPAPPAGSKYPYCGAQVSFNFYFFFTHRFPAIRATSPVADQCPVMSCYWPCFTENPQCRSQFLMSFLECFNAKCPKLWVSGFSILRFESFQETIEFFI